MIKTLLLLILLFEAGLCTGSKSTAVSINPDPSPPFYEDPFYYGGSFGFRLWNRILYLGLYPMLGYQVTPELSAGIRIGYAYINDDRVDPSLETSHYGASVFARYRILGQAYLHGEFMYFNVEKAIQLTRFNPVYTTERNWVPFLLLGGGYTYPLNDRVSIFAEVLFDVIRDDNSPFDSGDPFINIGVSIGY